MTGYLFLAGAVLFSVLGQLFLKKGILSFGQVSFSVAGLFSLFLHIFRNAWLFFGAVFFALAFVLWLFVLSKKELSVVYPISTGLTLSLVTLGGLFLLKEHISLFQVSGICFIVLGVFFLVKG